MTDRKKKIYLAQIFLLVAGLTVLIFTYQKKESLSPDQISIEKSENKPFEESEQMDGVDFFYNIQYSGIDRSGNRYILKAEKAISKKDSEEIIDMISVNAVFYIKDGTELYIKSDNGIYNNKTLDMVLKIMLKQSMKTINYIHKELNIQTPTIFSLFQKILVLKVKKGNCLLMSYFLTLKRKN